MTTVSRGIEPRNNAGGLMLQPGDAYQAKLDALVMHLKEYGVTDVIAMNKKFEPGDELDSVVISGVDSMEARQMIWPAVRDDGRVQLYLDGRIGGQHFTLLAVEPFDGDWYEKRWLFGSANAAPLPCAARNIVYASVGLGAEMGALLARFSRGEALPRRIERNYGGSGDFFQVITG